MPEYQHKLTPVLLEALAHSDFDQTSPYQSITELALVVYPNVFQLINRARQAEPEDTRQWLANVAPGFQESFSACFFEEDLDQLLVRVQQFMEQWANELAIQPDEWEGLVTGEIERTLEAAREAAEAGLRRLEEQDPALGAKLRAQRDRAAAMTPEAWRPGARRGHSK